MDAIGRELSFHTRYRTCVEGRVPPKETIPTTLIDRTLEVSCTRHTDV